MIRLAHILNKPEYFFRPSRIVAKIFFRKGRQCIRLVRTPWGLQMECKVADLIGKSLLTHGVYELGVSEALWRLTDPGDVCVDVGANIGLMTGLLAVRSGPHGKVFAFEPHPSIMQRITDNINRWKERQRDDLSPIIVEELAVADRLGTVTLYEPRRFIENEGVASLIRGEEDEPCRQICVGQTTLDHAFASVGLIGLLKVDVEGSELAVLEGARNLLLEKRVRDLVFENEPEFPSACSRLLESCGYTIYRLAKHFWGPKIWPPANKTPAWVVPWEPVNYLATTDASRARARLNQQGWNCLKTR